MSKERQKESTAKSQKSPSDPPRPTMRICREMSPRLTQGEFYRDLTVLESYSDKVDRIDVDEIYYPLAVLLNQDCDLNSDFRSTENRRDPNKKVNNDKDLIWLIFAPVFQFSDFLLGEHLSGLNMKMSRNEDASQRKRIQQNEVPRYHYIKCSEGDGLPEMIIDFKHFFTVSLASFLGVRNERFSFSAEPLFREAISQRFAYYLSRIGLPESN